MVQTITMNEATLVDGMVNESNDHALFASTDVFMALQAKFVAEDLSTLGGEANWWHQRVRLVEHWLRDETSRVIIPDDGTEEMIRRHIQRGDSYPRAQCKCWRHIVMELRDLPCFAGVVAQTKNHDVKPRVETSPSRGKLRPGKDLIVLSDDKCCDSNSNASTHDDEESNNASSSWSLEPLNPEIEQTRKPRPLSSAAYLSRRELGIDTTSAAPIGKSFAGMSLLERQMEWLQKKHDKMEAERLRQTEENERELTFQPKLIRRITYSGDKYFRDTPSAPTSSKSFARSESSRRVGETGTVSMKERTLPKVPRLSHHRRAKKKTPLQSASISEAVGVSCKLLDSMKFELQASLASSRTSETDIEHSARSELFEQGDDPPGSEYNTFSPSDHSGDEFHTPGTEAVPQEEEETPPAPAWSAKPRIGGRRADVDSSETKVRLILQDASKFELSTMYRKTDRRAGRDGVALHVGQREDTHEEQVIAVLFDREKVTQIEAERWWENHKYRFADIIQPQQPREEEAPIVLPASRAATPGIL
ncbi:hypothetical protein V7S43_005295 [Phytophthora oleae]|uniref:Uncharacterized protein n=1 Tax=Phytophthora oleae TaxID=2107226 RepID=A0ABD3FU00_9STRA